MIGNKPNTINSGGSASTTLPDVFLGSLSDTLPLSDLLETVNLTVEKGTIPVLFVTGTPYKGSQSVAKRYLWKLGAGEFNPIGGENIESKLELLEETFLSKDNVDAVLSSENAEEIALEVIAEDFISYMNNNGTYALTNVDKTYIITFTKDDIDYAYIFQGDLNTYGSGEAQLVADDFIFIYQSANAGDKNNSIVLKDNASIDFVQAIGAVATLASNNITELRALELPNENGMLATREWVTANSTGSDKYVIKGVIFQSGTNPPVITVYENNSPGSFTTTYDAVGIFSASLNFGVASGKVLFYIAERNGISSTNINYGSVVTNSGTTSFSIFTRNGTTLTNSLLTAQGTGAGVPFELVLYP